MFPYVVFEPGFWAFLTTSHEFAVNFRHITITVMNAIMIKPVIIGKTGTHAMANSVIIPIIIDIGFGISSNISIRDFASLITVVHPCISFLYTLFPFHMHYIVLFPEYDLHS
jgi:hypothetical protein